LLIPVRSSNEWEHVQKCAQVSGKLLGKATEGDLGKEYKRCGHRDTIKTFYNIKKKISILNKCCLS